LPIVADPRSEPRSRKSAAPRGLHDVLPEDWPYWAYVREAAERVATNFGYRRIDTPVFEHADVYLRAAGGGTDIVEKEMYVFEDRGGEEMALRPEGTAGVIRAYIEHGMWNLPQPVRLYYVAPNFRYDRPQAGRMRQHTQFGVEAIGEADPLVDAEVIELLVSFYSALGLQGVTLRLNSIGDSACRPAYVAALRAYYEPRLASVCEDDRVRFEKNPLRLLDCKEERCQPIIAGAPRIREYLCDDCRAHFERLLSYLGAQGVAYELDDRLVRGLDYYTRTTFEAHPPVEGAQSAIGAGGRYDGLAELLGGPATPGIGFGTGIERSILNLKRQEVAVPALAAPDLFVAHLTPEAAELALKLAGDVRARGMQAVVGNAGRSLKSQLRAADARHARWCAIIGANELRDGEVTLRNMEDHAEQRVKAHDLPGLLGG
jgi:histidyl-tRNA synthetase